MGKKDKDEARMQMDGRAGVERTVRMDVGKRWTVQGQQVDSVEWKKKESNFCAPPSPFLPSTQSNSRERYVMRRRGLAPVIDRWWSVYFFLTSHCSLSLSLSLYSLKHSLACSFIAEAV